LPLDSRWILGVALIAFVCSTGLALLISLPGSVTASDTTDLQVKVNREWNSDGWDQQVASILVEYLSDLRRNNATTAKFLIAAIGFQIAGIAGIAVAAVVILVHIS
jgi:hypothetical protein